MTGNDGENTDLDRILDKLSLRAEILNKETCMMLYNILIISGRLTPVELRKKTGLGKGSLFRSLKELLEAGIVEKEEDPDITDKRRSTFYYASDNIAVKIEEDLLKHAMKNGKIEKLNTIMTAFQNFPVAMSKFVASAIQSNQVNSRENNGKEAYGGNLVQYIKIANISNVNPLLEIIQGLVTELDKLHVKTPVDSKMPMRNPVVLTLSLTSLENAFQGSLKAIDYEK